MQLNQIAENISAVNTPTVGIAGEVRCVITGVDGEVMTDTGYFNNLILNQGLDFFGGSHGGYINTSCVIGSGNSVPDITQTKLDAFIAIATGTDATSDYSYVNKGDGLYRMWEQKKYRFTGLGNVNISEVGLVSAGSSSTNYYLTTRALIKDSLSAPTSISVKEGEMLDIYYKVHKVIDTTDKSFVINVLDGDGGAVPYNVLLRPVDIGNKDRYSITGSCGFRSGYSQIAVSSLEWVSVNEYLKGNEDIYNSGLFTDYNALSFSRTMKVDFGLNSANTNIRTVAIGYRPRNGINGQVDNIFGFYPFQMRIGRVSDDAPLTKTNKETLSIPLEFSWGRFEGDL